MSAYIVWFLLFSLNIVVIPVGISPFEAPKVIIAEIFIDILLLFTIFHFKKTDFKHLWSSQTILLGILLILSLDQLLLFHQFQNFFGNQFRMQGLFLFWHLLVFSFISRDIKLTHIPKAFYFLSLIFLTLGTIILGVNQEGRAFGTLGESNALAATALFIFPFAYFRARKSLKLFSFLITLIIIFFSGSRAGLVGFGIEIFFLTFINFFKHSLFRTTILSLILILLSLSLPLTEQVGWVENRTLVWQTAIQTGLQSPLIGQGFGNIQDPIHQTALKLDNPVQYQVVDSSHNFILDYWIGGGAVGVISILMLLFLSFQGLIRHKRILELTAFLGIITAMLFNPVSVVNLLAFWWLIGQGFAGTALRNQDG